MFSLRTLFSNGNNIYDLLNTSAEEGLHSVETLTRMLAHEGLTPSREELAGASTIVCAALPSRGATNETRH
jgi:hypothetical protein